MNEKQIVNSFKQKSPTIISKTFELPNNSGDHVRSIKRDTPINDSDLVNKKYVDDAIAGVVVEEEDPIFTASEAAEFEAGDKAKLDGIESGAEVNNISDANATDLTDSGASTLHYHAADRSRANHTGVEVLPAGTATAGTAPLKFTSGTNLTAAELGAIEFDGVNLYATVNALNQVTDTNYTIDATGSPGTGRSGLKFTTLVACTLVKATKDGTLDCTKAYLCDESKNVLSSVSFSGNDATFNYALSDDTTYWILCDKEGSSYNDRFKGPISYPNAKTNVTFIKSVNATPEEVSNQALSFNSITTSTATITRKKFTLESV